MACLCVFETMGLWVGGRNCAKVRLTSRGASRFAALPSTLATVISNMPPNEPEQPAGACSDGAMGVVTPWARARLALPVRARAMLMSCIVTAVDVGGAEDEEYWW